MRLIDADNLESAKFHPLPYTHIVPKDTDAESYKRGWNDAIDAIVENEPKVSSEPQWIPCSERTPKDLEAVNVTWVNHNPEPYYSFAKDVPFTASAIYYKGRWFWYSSVCADVLAEYGNNHSDEVDSDVEITAWTPLPKAYKGDT